MSAREDGVARATTTDGAFRVIAAITTGAVAALGVRDGERWTASLLWREVTGELGDAPPAEPGEDASTALMRALAARDVPAMASVVALPGPDGVRVAGGYLVEVLPGASRAAIDELTDHLGNLAPLATWLDGRAPGPAGLVAILMGGLPHEQLATSALRA